MSLMHVEDMIRLYNTTLYIFISIHRTLDGMIHYVPYIMFYD